MHEAGQWERLATRPRRRGPQRLKEPGAGADADGGAGAAAQRLQVHAHFAERVGRTTSSGCMPRSRRPPVACGPATSRRSWRDTRASHWHRARAAHLPRVTPAWATASAAPGVRDRGGDRPWPCSCRWGVSAGVFCRYVLHRPLAGADEGDPRPGLADVSGGAVAQRRHAHPRVSLGLRRSRRRPGWTPAHGWSRSASSRGSAGRASACSGCGSARPRRVPRYEPLSTGGASASRRRALPWAPRDPAVAGPAPCWRGRAGSGWAARCSSTSRVASLPHLPTTGVPSRVPRAAAGTPPGSGAGVPRAVALQGLGGPTC